MGLECPLCVEKYFTEYAIELNLFQQQDGHDALNHSLRVTSDYAYRANATI